MLLIFVFVALIASLLIILSRLSSILSPAKLDLKGSHVLAKLEDAKKELEKERQENSDQKIEIISVDISKDFDKVQEVVKQAEDRLGPVDVLVNNAGFAGIATFDDMSVDSFQRMVDVNLMGSVYVTKAAIKSMKAKKHGRIVFVSSQAGQVGIYGFTAYSASKFAIRGFAESLQMEVVTYPQPVIYDCLKKVKNLYYMNRYKVKPYNLYVTVVYPPDTDTPGLKSELEQQPKETQLISETTSLLSADTVAKKIVDDAVNGKFHSYFGIDGSMLTTVSSGLSPVHSLLDAIFQVVTVCILKFVTFFYAHHFDSIVKKCYEEKKQDEKVKTS